MTAAAGIQFTHNSGRAGKKLPARDHGLRRRLLRRRRRRLARHPAGQQQGLDAARAQVAPGPLPQQPQRHLHRRDDGQRPRRRDVRHGRGRRPTTTTTASTDVYITALEGDRLFHNVGGRQVPGRDHGVGHPERELRHQRRLARLRQGRPGSICSSPTTCSGARTRISGARSTARPSPTARRSRTRGPASKLYRNLGGGKFEDVSREGRRGRSDEQVARHRRARLQRRRLARPLRGQRHAAQQALPQQRRTARFAEEGLEAGVAFGEDGVARGAMGVDAADYDRSGRPHLLVGNFSNQMLGLYHNEGNGLFVDEAPRLGGRPGEPADARLRRLLLRLRPRRPARHLRGQRPHRRGDRPRAAEGPVPAAAAALPQPGQGQVRAGDRAPWARAQPAARGARRGLRRLSTATATSTCC